MQPERVQQLQLSVLRGSRCFRRRVCVATAGSSTDVSEDWEKDFDLDMTEEEVQMALSKIETSGEVKCLFNTSLLSGIQVKKINHTANFSLICFSVFLVGRGLGELGLRDTSAPAPSLHSARSQQTNHARCIFKSLSTLSPCHDSC